MAPRSQAGEPTLAEAWAMLGERLGLAVDSAGERAVRAHGHVRGRPVDVEITGGGGRREFARFFFGNNTVSSRNRRERWHTVLSVGCANPSGTIGTIESAVDVDHPDWNPREYNPRNGRAVRADPPSLVQRALTPETYEQLMSIVDDVTIEVRRDAIHIDHHATAIPSSGANYVAGSLIHHYQGSPPPWPERALVGPTWWINLVCDLADALDR